ncbi:MAG: hypothetical protein KDA32_02550 [Phycisphaerales bacterium]|nr:hypothetical protein [Phycisphaerales bacterium]
MPRDYFATLGLKPGRYDADEIDARFAALRARLLIELRSSATRGYAERRLEEAYQARSLLRDPRSQAMLRKGLEERDDGAERLNQLRAFVLASLEEGLLRHSRRQACIEEGMRLGFTEFHTHLVIAQTQFDGRVVIPPPAGRPERKAHAIQVVSRAAAVGVLALGLFLVMVRWAQ